MEKRQPRREMTKINNIKSLPISETIVATERTLFFRKPLFLVVLFLGMF